MASSSVSLTSRRYSLVFKLTTFSSKGLHLRAVPEAALACCLTLNNAQTLLSTADDHYQQMTPPPGPSPCILHTATADLPSLKH